MRGTHPKFPHRPLPHCSCGNTSPARSFLWSVGVTKLIIADDHTLLREGLKLIFSRTDDINVVGEACDGAELLALLKKHTCQVLLLNMEMPGISDVELIKRIKQERPLVAVLILSVCDDSHQALRAFKAGVAGYATKRSEPEVLIAAIRKVAAGERYVAPHLAEQALEFGLSDNRPTFEKLSEREFQVLKLLITGKRITEIAMELALSSKTVSTHKSRLMDKLGIKNNGELIRYGVKHSLFEQGVVNPSTLNSTHF